MTRSARLATPDEDNPAPSRTTSCRRPGVRRLGAGGIAVLTLLGGGVAVGAAVAAQSQEAPTTTAPSRFVAIKGYRAFDSRVDYTTDKIDDGLAVGVGEGSSGVSIPREAVAVAYTVTVTATEGSGFAYVDSFDFGGESDISTVAWTGPGQRVVNSGIVPTFEGDTSAHMIQVGVGGTDAAAHIIIDITGYLIPDA